MAEIKRGRPAVSAPQKRFFGLRFKMFFLFLFFPIVLIIAASFLYMNHMKTLSGLITKEGSKLVTKMAEEAIAERARAVAREVQLYLKTHPDLKREDFNTTPEFVAVAMQKVGQTGYTFIVSRATKTEPDYIWVYPNQKLIGIDIVKAMKERLGDEYERWLKIQGKPYEIGGYYKWFDGREKYTYTAPVQGTNFNIASTTYIDEFTLPMIELQERANKLTVKVTQTIMIIFIAIAVLICFFVLIYSYKLSGRIKKLSAAADRISLGDVDFEMERIRLRDEIEDLADAFSRMQESIRLALKRLRERR